MMINLILFLFPIAVVSQMIIILGMTIQAAVILAVIIRVVVIRAAAVRAAVAPVAAARVVLLLRRNAIFYKNI